MYQTAKEAGFSLPGGMFLFDQIMCFSLTSH